jgi:Peptidase family M28
MLRSRSRIVRAILLLVSLGAAAQLGAQTRAHSPTSTRTSAAINVADLRSRLFLIADDSMAGRETGSKGDFQTAEYVAAEFKRLGLKPMGEQGTWFQTVPFFILKPAANSIAVGDGSTLRWGIDYVILGPPLPARATSELSVVYGGAANDTSTWIDAARATGKVMVLDIRPDSSGKRGPVSVTRSFNSPHFAGAIAIAVAQLDLLSPGAAANLERVTPRPDTTRLTNRPVVLVVTSAAADRLLGASARSLVMGAAGGSMQGDLGLLYMPVQYPARNVIGVLPGRDPRLRGQYVSLTGHNDHVGVCMSAVDHDSMRAFLHVLRPMGADTRTWNETPEATAQIRHMLDSLRRIHPVRADSICNGADDDGTGTVAILELAEAFARSPMAQRPRRSLLFVSHTGEERGLVGSAWYTDHPTVPIDFIVAEIDEDMIGRGTAWDLPKGGPEYLEVVGARRLSNEFGELLEAANKAQPKPFVFNYEFDVPGHPLQYYCRADHYSYARYGIPSVAFSRGEHLDYHQVTDEPQYIDYVDMQRVVKMVHDAALRIGNLDHPPKLDKPKGDPRARCVQ